MTAEDRFAELLQAYDEATVSLSFEERREDHSESEVLRAMLGTERARATLVGFVAGLVAGRTDATL